MRFSFKSLGFAAAGILTGLLFVMPVNTVAAISDYGHLIDDHIFDNASSMTATQIDAFLNSFPGSCLSTNNGFSTPDPTGWSSTVTTNHGYTFGGNVSAGQAIYDAARIYNLSPQTILTTLQKEQSVVTGAAGCHYTNPSPGMACTYAGGGCVFIAMSYACPGNCDYSYNGFSLQLIAGTWLLRFAEERAYGILTGYAGHDPGDENIYYSGAMTAGYRQRSASSSSVYYDGSYTTQDGISVTIANGSTASLYYYTPFTSGNTSFVNIFNQWFGSTFFPQPVGASLYLQTSNGAIYLVINNTRYYVPNWNMMVNYGLDVYPSIGVSDSTISGLTDGGTLSNLVTDSSGNVYLVNDRSIYHVSPTICTAWGLSCFDSTVVKNLGSTFESVYLQNGFELAQLESINGVIYELSNGQKDPIANPKTLNDLGLNTTAVIVSSAANSNQPLGSLLMTTPGVVSFAPSSTIYYYDGSAYYSVPNMTSFSDWGLIQAVQLSVPLSSYNTTPPSSSSLSPWYQDTNGNKYIIDQGRKVQIPTPLQSLWQSVTFGSQPPTLTNNLPLATLQQNIWTSPDIYVLSSGAKHYVPTWNDYQNLGITNATTTALRQDKLLPVPTGNDALGDGTIIMLQGDTQKRYIINNGLTTWIPDPSTYNAFGFDWSPPLSYTSSVLNDYPAAPAPLSSGKTDNTYYVLGVNGAMYQLLPSMATDYGAINSQFQNFSPRLVLNTHSSTLSRFLYNVDNGQIYYASGGAIHYIATQNAFKAYGGTYTQASAVNSGAINLFLQGQVLY